jgi:hypothetical protein
MAPVADPRAGELASRQALGGRRPKAVLVFAAHTVDADKLLCGIQSVVGDAPVVGCTTAGEIGTGRACYDTVTVVAIGGEGIEATAAFVNDTHLNSMVAAEELCTASQPSASLGHRAAILLVDGFITAKREFAAGVYAALGASTKVVGGGAGDGLSHTVTRQFCGRTVLERGAVGLGLTCEAPFGTGLGFGFESSGKAAIVTEVDGDSIVKLDHRAALDVYCERVAQGSSLAGNGVDVAIDFFGHPLGLDRGGVTEPVTVIGGDGPTGRIRCGVPVPEGSSVSVLSTNQTLIREASVRAVRAAAVGPTPPVGFLVFDCALRWASLDEGFSNEVAAAIGAEAAPAVAAGMASYGEIGRTRGPCSFYASSISVLAVR